MEAMGGKVKNGEDAFLKGETYLDPRAIFDVPKDSESPQPFYHDYRAIISGIYGAQYNVVFEFTSLSKASTEIQT
jgi:hypothetical protein